MGKSEVIPLDLESIGSPARRNHEAGVPTMLASPENSRDKKVNSLNILLQSSSSDQLEAQIAHRSLSDSLQRLDDVIVVSQDVN